MQGLLFFINFFQCSAFPGLITASSYVNLKLFRDPKQSNDESFSDYYTSVVDLYWKHAAEILNIQIIDWLKFAMKITSYEEIQDEGFDTTQV